MAHLETDAKGRPLKRTTKTECKMAHLETDAKGRPLKEINKEKLQWHRENTKADRQR